MSFSAEIAARTLWQESRGEPIAGQKAVAHVIWNRIRDGRWGPNAATVCLWRNQFSGWLSADPNFRQACILAEDDTTLDHMRQIFAQAESESDPTDGALYYYAASMKNPPEWSKAMTFKGQIGAHKFWTDRLPKGGLMA